MAALVALVARALPLEEHSCFLIEVALRRRSLPDRRLVHSVVVHASLVVVELTRVKSTVVGLSPVTLVTAFSDAAGRRAHTVPGHESIHILVHEGWV